MEYRFFWCICVGHVKKVLQMALAKICKPMFNDNHACRINQRAPRVTSTEDRPVSGNKMKEPEHRRGQEQGCHDTSFSALSQACLKLKQIANESLQCMEPLVENEAVTRSALDEDETILIQGALLDVTYFYFCLT